ncbi:hypothetical protein DITRI_Ditri12bG0028000 [Diplodiscus trichospermus]
MKFFSALFYFLIFLFINETEARKDPPICSSSCGDIPNISYPFRLKEDPAACGDPDFQLSCRNNKTILNFHGGLYYVKRISYDYHTLYVADVNLANGSCSLPHRSLTMDEVQSDARYPGLVNYNYSYTLNYVRCSSNISDLANSRAPCLSGNQSQVYVNVTWYSLSSYYIPKSCKVIATAPAFYEETLQQYPSYETVLKMQKSGFQMRWSVECRDCRAKGHGCVYKNSDTTFLFECEKEYDYEAALRLIYTVLASWFLSGIIFFVRFILLPLVVFAFILHKYFSTRKELDAREEFSETQQPWTPERYTYADILAMSNNFKDRIGQGCFGTVYKGQLPGGCSIAVKMLEGPKVTVENFVNEISRISRIHHPNVAPILGFCSEGSKYALVYQYMPNGSLDKHIFSKGGNSHSFSWEKLHEIALGTARGVEFLHGSSSDACIVHLDIKPQNILLDENFIPKISDFCYGKLYPKKHDVMSSNATSETFGYMAPELISGDFGAVSSKSDVYSFGMLLLELTSGRRNVDVDAIYSSKVHFPSWVFELNERGDLEIENVTESDAIIARKLFIIGLWCTQTKASDRPSMTRVVEMLQGNTENLEMPPKPAFFSPQYPSVTEPEPDSVKEMLIPESLERSS